MTERNVALVAETEKIRAAELRRVENALQTRMKRDVAPVWDVTATVQAYRKLENVPAGTWTVVIRDDIRQPGAASYHSVKDNLPFTMVAYHARWPFYVSHDLLEMLIDPFGNRLTSGPDPRPGRRQKRVAYLVEVCDPCAAEANGYEIDGVRMADFCTPSFYDPEPKTGARYSFTGAVTKPFEVLREGYITWQEIKSKRWWQTVFFGDKPVHRDLGVFGSEESGPSVRRRRVSMQMVILRQIQEADDPSSVPVQPAIEELIRAYGRPG
jgi:hypothetical protein